MHLAFQANSGLSVALIFLLFYLYHGIGITLGYHRLLSHKCVSMPKWLMYFIVMGGYLSFMGSPIVWVAMHRSHHQNTDLAKDPHSPLHGLFHSFIGWMFELSKYLSNDEIKQQTKDLFTDPVWRFLGTKNCYKQGLLCLGFCTLYRCLLFCIGGVNLVIINIIACCAVSISTQLVNVICHKPQAWFSYRNYPTNDNSLNVWWVGILALGEGFHNNHHHNPKSARHGLRWFEFDFTWLVIMGLKKLRLVWNIYNTKNLNDTYTTHSLDRLENLETTKL